MELEWDWPGKAEGALPAAKLENRFEDVHTRCGTGAVLYTEHQPTEPTLYSIHTDHLGTPMELAGQDGQLAWVGHYRAWGKLTKASDGHGNPSTTDNPLRFQGQYLDEETGLHYNRHRYYDPETGRFTTQDPIGLAGGENLYMYAPNPTGWVDPLGLSGCRSQCRAALEGKNWEFNPEKDLDLRGTGKSHHDGLTEAFRRTGVPREQFEVTKWGTDVNGKSVPVEWQAPNGANVNMDIPEWNNVGGNGGLGNGPHAPHIGYQVPGKPRSRGHIFVDNIPATRR